MTRRWRAAALILPLMLGPAPALLAQSAVPQAPAAGTAAPASPAGDASTGGLAQPATPAQPAAAAAPASAPPQPAAAPAAVDATLPHDLSPWSMFLNADIVVKVVMVGLLLASVATWTIWFAKSMHLVAARRSVKSGLRALTGADGLAAAAAAGTRGPVAALVGAAVEEVTRSGGLPAEGVKERAALALQRIEVRASRAIAAGTGVLATVGSVAPFVGLFGTVWGIMNSFVGISQAHTSNLAVVAPGIAEALLATAVGLVAAIPAVVIFNGFARATAGYKALLGDASAEVMRHLSRDLDRRAGPRRQAAE